MKKRENDLEAVVTYKVAHLLEFYDRRILLRFFQGCDEYDCAIHEAFITVEETMMDFIAGNGCIPNFADLAELYSKEHGWSFKAYSGYTKQHVSNR